MCFRVIGDARALLIGLLLIALPASLSAASPASQADPLSNVQRDWLTQRGQLHVGIVLQAPYAQLDRRAQQLSGANVDLINLMEKTLQVELLWRSYADQAELEKALVDGQIDFAPGLMQTPAGLRMWLYSPAPSIWKS
jgi:ABC-type amino acid transport substrate-binding protein